MREFFERFADGPGGAVAIGAFTFVMLAALSVKPDGPELVASTATLDALAPPAHAGLVSVYSP